MVSYLFTKLCDMTKDELRDFLHWFRNNKHIVHLMDNDMIITQYFIEFPKLISPIGTPGSENDKSQHGKTHKVSCKTCIWYFNKTNHDYPCYKCIKYDQFSLKTK